MNAPLRTPSAADSAPYEFMGPSLLSKQPPSLPPKNVKDDPNWQTVYTHLETRLGAMRSWRWAWWAYWAVLARFFVPFRYVWLVVANKMWRGSPLNDSIIDSTGQQAVGTCASGMWTGLTSPSRPWFKVGIALPWVKLAADAKAWLEDLEQKLYTVLGQSNFYDIMAQAFGDEVVFGQAPVICYEDEEDVARFYLPAAGEYYLDVGARLANDTLYREFTLNVKQIVEQFTLARCPQQVAGLWRTAGAGLSSEFVVCHAIEPNFALDQRKGSGKVNVVPAKFTWREVYWLKGIKTSQPLSKRGFNGQPHAVFGWKRVSNDAYFRSPCMDALGDQKQAQQETLNKGEYIQKGIRPPMGADVSLKNEPASIMPAQITFMATDGTQNKKFWPLFEVAPQWVAVITADIDKVIGRIEKCLFVDTFMAISRMEGVQPRNELELTKRDLERLQVLGPVISLNEGALDIVLRRLIDILTRRRMLAPMPASLHGIPLKIAYVSIMRLAQKSAEAIAMKDGFATATQLSAAAKAAGLPDPMRIINLDDALRHYLEVTNFRGASIFTDTEVQEHDKAREQAKQQAQIPGQAMAAVQAAKTLGDTNLSGNTALGAITGR